MQRRPLGNTGIELSELGFGCSSWWAKSAFPEEEALALVHDAIEQGVCFFDTGSNYAGGQAEQRLGKALQAHRGARIVVATKAGTWVAPDGSFYRDFSPPAVRRGLARSLENLKLERVDLLHLHAPAPEQLTDELLRCLEDLKREGLVGFCGINGFSTAMLERVLAHPILSTMMLDFNLLCVERKKAIERLANAGKGVIAATPLAQAHFSNKLFKPTRLADLWYIARAIGRNRHSLRRGFAFRFVNDYPGWSGAEIALAYVLSNPHVTVAVFGTTNGRRLRENLAVSGRVLPQEIIERIEAT